MLLGPRFELGCYQPCFFALGLEASHFHSQITDRTANQGKIGL
jgi:hypothetical protein